MEVSMVVGFFKKNFFLSGVNICWFKQFWNFDFSEKITWLWFKILICGLKSFYRNFRQKIWIGHIYPVQKILDNFFQKLRSYRHFRPQRWENGLFLRPHKSKKGKKVPKGYKKVLKNVLKKTWILCLFGPQSVWKNNK